jgi:hypothetical protein
MSRTDTAVRVISASPDRVFAALTDSDALAVWLPPVIKTCPHANACLTCPMFVTTPEFLSQHRQQREQLLQVVSAAEARGQLRIVEMNKQVLGNLESIIVALETDRTARTPRR